jgi:hypothetical protein
MAKFRDNAKATPVDLTENAVEKRKVKHLETNQEYGFIALFFPNFC